MTPRCSWHMAAKSRRRFGSAATALVAVIVAVALLALVVVWYTQTLAAGSQAATMPTTAQANRGIPVIAAKASKGDLPIYVNGLGTVTALNTVTVRTRVDGQLMKVAYQEGQLVKAGDQLVQIDPRPFQVQLAQAEGQLAKDQALLGEAKLDLKRYEEARETVSQQQIDTAASLVAQYEGAIKVDQGQIDNAKLQLTYCQITAPIAGIVGLRLVDEGNMVHATDTTGIVVITQEQPISVVFSLPEDNLTQVLQARKADPSLAVDVYGRDLRTKLSTGKLLAMDNQIDPTTATFRLKAVCQNEDRMLYPNQFVNVRMLVSVRKDAILVPAAAIQRSPQGTFVYVVKDDQTVDVRNVTTGPTEGDMSVVLTGVNAGDTVVTDGVDKLQPGAKVSVRTAGGSTTQKAAQADRGGGAQTESAATRRSR